ncbi:TPA: phospholipase D-like domain-containing protein [Enterobacter cloacae]|uniref:phospholipase D-like domain-containing protein n=1 Tax=Enterobacter cloacae complex TaxID=354276 RepID=UPI0009B46C4F|nr:phospholipase D-like domain-containing protein [Enterobacter cloacae]HBM7664771.1 phospholipase [Enterobacter cloacae subsp. cloacae]MCK6804245.1 phospholipase D-like domain-containing protein [Enterobacter cloacae]MCK6826839.1 phospholipase D-like domain-containing protein [Enterobacter cloacae]MCM7171028.1 phospholipase D-like domain-containing protein [Enterobacter cloacae]MDT0536113.1 phospholipase D-like domain-containing protein [Enterobacter cloacae]
MGSLKLDDGMNRCSVYFEDKCEESYIATATHNHWVHYTSGPERQSENFAEYTEGNVVQAFLGGKEYFSALLAAFKQAKKCIYITGWQVNWDAQLAEGIRLVDALLESVQTTSGLQVYIMPWENPAQVETYAAATERVFAAMNTHLGRQAFYVQRAGSKSGVMFSHHQKCVIVDEKLAFVGGIDLAYGRYDDHYGLQANADGRQGMNMYNSCIPPIVHRPGYDPMNEYVIPVGKYSREQQQGELKRAEKRQTDSVQHIIDTVLKHELWQSQGRSKDSVYLDPTIQPRMPWQDYQVQIEGPAVDDLIRNFVLRWNSYSHRWPDNPLQTRVPELEIPAIPSVKKGSCQVQVLRSASLNMRLDEHKNMPEIAPKARLKQDDILRSLHLLISKAEHYIYIENQFFVSAFEKSSITPDRELSPVANNLNPKFASWATRLLPNDEAPQNPVAEWLGDRIKRAIFSHMTQPFHVCIVLPVHPEGRLDDPAIVAQIHLTRQSLVFGSHSLLNRIRRSLWVKQQLETQEVPRREWSRKITELEEKCGDEYQNIPLEACDEYVTLLNLRDHAELNGMAVTEQIYVHSKLMIVDDRYVLVGSANINDRSLLGDRDSELAVLISDTEHGYTDLDGSGTAVPYRNFARELRQKAWRKWLGSAAGECAEVLDKPSLKVNWEKIQALAKKNLKTYENVFDFIPRDNKFNSKAGDENYLENSESESENDVVNTRASIWPVVAVNTPAGSENMPFSDLFWRNYNKKNHNIKKVKGFFHALPVHWTENENNLIQYNMRLIASRTQQNNDEVELLDNKNNLRMV